MAVPYFRLEVSDAERQAVDRVLRSGWLTMGAEVLAFEEEFAAAISRDITAVAVNSNTAGLHLALEACGIGPGDEVIVPSLTFTATAEVVRYLGAEPVLVDVDPDTLCLDMTKAERAVTARTKALMPVHFGGLGADMKAVAALASRHGLEVIEDCAHSFPATAQGRHIGSHGSAAAVFSFYANKTLTTGEGGMVVTANERIAKRCRVMRLHGMDRDAFQRFTGKSSQWRYDVVAPGFKYNMTDVAASMGREQLKVSLANRAARQRIAERYASAFRRLPLWLPFMGENDMHAWHLYPIRLLPDSRRTREVLEIHLHTRGIGYSMHYTPLHRLSYWRERYNLTDEAFPVSSAHGDSSLSLPIFSAMRDAEIDEVIDAVASFFGANTQ